MRKRLESVKIGIMPLKTFKERTIVIAKGQYKPERNEPNLWFSSMKSLANILSEKNQCLLRLIIDEQPQSISSLAKLTHRRANNLLRTLRMMEAYGFVTLKKGKKKARGRTPLIPEVLYNMEKIEVCLLGSHTA